MHISDPAILHHLHIEAFSPMQEAAIRAQQNGHDLVLLSPTGSGKTLAFLVPLASAVDATSGALQAVVVVPSRELALQCHAVFERMKTGLKSLPLYGGRPTMEEHRRLRDLQPQVVFATPGRLCDHLSKENILPATVRRLVVDEYDKCLELGFQAEMEQLTARLTAVRQTVFTSATPLKENVGGGELAQRAAKADVLDCLETLPAAEGGPDAAERIRTYLVRSPRRDKLETLARLLSQLPQASVIVFVAHRESAERVCAYLKREGLDAVLYHGGLEQQLRERALFRFRSGCASVLVSTDLAARGLDIPEVEAVVHYHLSPDAEAFTHRQGRTARWEREGRAYLILNDADALPDYLPATVEELDVEACDVRPQRSRLTTLYIGRGKKEKLSKGDIVGFLCKKGGLRSDELGLIEVQDHQSYVSIPRRRLREVLQLVQGERIKGMKTLVEEMRS
ncbi:MAG: DEAD/DEAH box helicase [Alloprevotella sp.]